MPMLADVVDAIVGGDTHRDTHALELIAPSGVSITTASISNDEPGFATALAWIIDHARRGLGGTDVVTPANATRPIGAEPDLATATSADRLPGGHHDLLSTAQLH